MKNRWVLALCAGALSSVAVASACDDYFAKMQASLEKEGDYSGKSMEALKKQVNGIPQERQEAFCKTAMENMEE